MTTQTQHKPRRVTQAKLSCAFGIVGVAGIPIVILNNGTGLLALIGVTLGIIALWGTRKKLAIIGIALCVTGLVGTLAMQAHWASQLDQFKQSVTVE